jgi:hypothetical protein
MPAEKGYTFVRMQEAKERLDKFINKQRVALYKPIQIAEILYRVRAGELQLSDLDHPEKYRNPSKKWRDEITQRLIGRVCTSSQRFQDDLFQPHAVPPDFLKQLAEINNQCNGVVERYIYQRFWKRQKVILEIVQYVQSAGVEQFNLEQFLISFQYEPGIRRSIDKAYEIVVYALFNALLHELRIHVHIKADPSRQELLTRFEDFTRLLLGIDSGHPERILDARIFRTGVTNAADRGLDMWTNFGPAVQVKHISLSEELAEDIVGEIYADEMVIVCRDADAETIGRVCQQLGHKVKGIIRESQLQDWYARALQPELRDSLGKTLIESLIRELRMEFPYSETFEKFYKEERQYDQIPKPDRECPFWEPD